MIAHTVTITINAPSYCATDSESESVDCPGTLDAEGTCTSCLRSLEEVVDDGDLVMSPCQNISVARARAVSITRRLF